MYNLYVKGREISFQAREWPSINRTEGETPRRHVAVENGPGQ